VYARVRQSCLEDKKNGKEKDYSAWNSAWMKEPDYYAKLNTQELAVECFTMPDPGRFGRECQLRVDLGGRRIIKEVFHNGFAEWFKRGDINPRVAHASASFDQMGTLYIIPPLRKQITGRERIFLASCLRVVEKYRKYMDDSISAGDDSLDFFCEATEFAQLTMLLARQVDLQRYAQIETAITSVRFLDEQNDRDLLSFLTLVVDNLDGFVTSEDNKNLDEILGKGASRPEPVPSVTSPTVGLDELIELFENEEKARIDPELVERIEYWEMDAERDSKNNKQWPDYSRAIVHIELSNAELTGARRYLKRFFRSIFCIFFRCRRGRARFGRPSVCRGGFALL
jgi:hypothetical protein